MIRRLASYTPRGVLERGVSRLRRVARVWRRAREAAEQNGSSTWRILREQVVLKNGYALDRWAYYQYRLFDPAIPFEEKTRYLPDDRESNRQLWSLLTPDKYRCLYDNKLIFNGFFRALNFPLAEVYGVFDPLFGYTRNGRSLRSPADLQGWMESSGAGGFVFKPLEGIQGHMVLVFVGPSADHPGKFVTLAGESYDAEEIVASTANSARLERSNPGANTRSFLIEERLRPHPELVRFIGSTLCTIRVQTIIAVDGMPRIVAAVFKLQPKPVGVDHLIHGAVGCWVDLETGVLGRGRTRGSLEYATLIPDTNTSFVGFRLPCWEETKDLALRAAGAFPWARSIGWDIALSDRGPVLVEGNERWSPSLIQLPAPHGLMTGELRALREALRNGNGG